MPIELSRLEKGVLLLMEWVLLFAASLVFSKWGGTVWHQFWTVLGLGAILASGMFVLNFKLKQTKMGVYYALCLGTILLTWLVLSWPVIVSFGFTLYFMWRLFQFIEVRTNEHRWWLWLLTIGLVLVLLLVFKSWAMHLEVVIVAGLQTFLILGSEMLQEWRLSKKITGSLTVFLGFLGVLVSGVVVSLVFPLIKWVLNMLLNLILLLVLYVAKFLWLIMSRLIPRAQAHKAILNNLFKISKQNQKQLKITPNGHGLSPEMLLGLVIVGLLIIAYLILRKWRFTSNRSQPAGKLEAAAVSLPSKRMKSRFFDPLKAPKDPIRAAIFNLQKRTRKSKYARKNYETLSEWLERLSEKSDLRQNVQTVYEQVRYGHTESVTNSVRNDYLKAIEQVATDLNEKGEN